MRKYLPALSVLAAALVAALMRAKQLTGLISADYGLLTPRQPLTIILTAYAAAVSLLITALILRSKTAGRTVPMPLGLPWFFLSLAACLCLFGSGLSLLRRGLSQGSATLLIYAVLSLASAVCLVFFADAARRNEIDRTRCGLIATLTVFWGCYSLIMDYWNRAGDPTLQSYLYPMLALLFCALALLSAGGFFYGNERPRQLKITTLLGLFFATLTLGGMLFAIFAKDPGSLRTILRDDFSASTVLPHAARPSLDMLLRFAFIVLHMTALFTAARSGLFAGINASDTALPEAPQPEAGIPLSDEREALTDDEENDIL